ncbi:YfiR/HmsC family protein [Rubrivirga sp. IMCC45206]|uniref:YfiR/HmsC family protein n=1 Tax=Rubrivirga sp. IMCC45206 TaxID=3391614 RepID=UPI00398F95AE
MPALSAAPRWIAVALLLMAAGGHADDMEVPVGRQVPLLTRVLAFDRSMAGSRPLVVAIVYQERNRASRQAFEAAAAAFSRATVQGRAVRVAGVPMTSLPRVSAALRSADVAYVAPLRGVDVAALVRASAAAGVLTVTGVRAYVQAGAAVGIGLRDGRPEILLHRRAARAAGADFSARLLQLATFVD